MTRKSRFDVILNDKMIDLFEEVTEDGESRNEAFKKAMAIYKIIKQREKQGSKIFLEKDGERTQLIMS